MLHTELSTIAANPAGIYLLIFNNKNTRTMCEICSKLTTKMPERRQWRRFGIFIAKLTVKIPERRPWRRFGIFFVNFEHISHLVLVFLLLTLNM